MLRSGTTPTYDWEKTLVDAEEKGAPLRPRPPVCQEPFRYRPQKGIQLASTWQCISADEAHKVPEDKHLTTEGGFGNALFETMFQNNTHKTTICIADKCLGDPFKIREGVYGTKMSQTSEFGDLSKLRPDNVYRVSLAGGGVNYFKPSNNPKEISCIGIDRLGTSRVRGRRGTNRVPYDHRCDPYVVQQCDEGGFLRIHDVESLATQFKARIDGFCDWVVLEPPTLRDVKKIDVAQLFCVMGAMSVAVEQIVLLLQIHGAYTHTR